MREDTYWIHEILGSGFCNCIRFIYYEKRNISRDTLRGPRNWSICVSMDNGEGAYACFKGYGQKGFASMDLDLSCQIGANMKNCPN